MTVLYARSAEEFRARAEHGYVAGDAWLYFGFDASLFGFILWGSPSRDDLLALMRLLDDELERPAHAALVDVSGVEVMTPPSFEVIAAYTEKRFAALSKSVTRAALVRPRGFNGALASGFFGSVPQPFEVFYAEDAAGALVALGRANAAAEARALAKARVEVEGVPTILRKLRVYLDADLSRRSLEDAATAAGVSTRTLQRSLTELETSFVREVQDARVRKAERLLLETEEPLTRIAFEVGCASPQHFSLLFKKRRGLTPTEFRARHKDDK